MSGPSLAQPCAFRFAASSAQTFFTSDLLLKTQLLNQCLVFDVCRIFRERELLSIESRCRRLTGRFFVRLGDFRVVIFVGRHRLLFLVRLFRDLKLFRYLTQRGEELDVHIPLLAECIYLAMGGEFTCDFAVFIGEIGRLNVADRAEALLLVSAVNDLAAKDSAIFVDAR